MHGVSSVPVQLSLIRRDREQLESEKRAVRAQIEEFEVKKHKIQLEIQTVNQQVKAAKEDKRDADTIRSQMEKMKEQLARQEVRPPLRP